MEGQSSARSPAVGKGVDEDIDVVVLPEMVAVEVVDVSAFGANELEVVGGTASFLRIFKLSVTT